MSIRPHLASTYTVPLAHKSLPPTRHLDRFSRFAGLNGVPNAQAITDTHTATTERHTYVATQRIYAMRPENEVELELIRTVKFRHSFIPYCLDHYV